MEEESKKRSKTDDLIGLSDKRRSQLMRSQAKTMIDLTKKKVDSLKLAPLKPFQQTDQAEESKEAKIFNANGQGASLQKPVTLSKKRVLGDFLNNSARVNPET